MNWLYYLLEANLYLLIFYGFYRLLLYNETFYNNNRYYLLLSSFTAFVLPILQIGYLKPPTIINQLVLPTTIPYGEENLTTIAVAQIQESFNYTHYLYPIYLFVALCFAIKLAGSLGKIIHLWLTAKKQRIGLATLIELNDQTTAFSFFNLLFIHPNLAAKQTVLNHEMVHIKQKHSIDILFFELLQIMCWFNPIIYFIKKDIKLLHEYIADELTTNTDIQKHEYAMFLIENSFGITPTALTNQLFNQSILKRRINMLNKKRTAGWARLRLLLALPLAGGMLCASTMAFTKDYGFVDLLPEKSISTTTAQEEVPKVENIKKQTKPKAENVKKNQVKFPPPVVKVDKNYFFPMRSIDKEGKINSLDKRYIVINGKKIEDLNTFFGVRDATKIVHLNGPDAVKKYGTDAKYGAVEITGNNLRWVKSINEGPPPPRMDQVKFPPPIVKPAAQDHFYVKFRKDKKTGEPIRLENRYVVINDKPVDLNTFYGVTNTESVKFLDGPTATKKYGNKAEYGAVEITGGNIKYITAAVEPPPTVKFPPPIVHPKHQNGFLPSNSYKDGNTIVKDKRYIVINGTPIVDNSKFYGVLNTETVSIIAPVTAMKKYGSDNGKYGAVEITGKDAQYISKIPVPPTFKSSFLDRKKSELFKLAHNDDEVVALTVSDKAGKVVYNDTNYKDTWDGKLSNYKSTINQKIPAGVYQYIMKIDGKPLESKRGQVTIL